MKFYGIQSSEFKIDSVSKKGWEDFICFGLLCKHANMAILIFALLYLSSAIFLTLVLYAFLTIINFLTKIKTSRTPYNFLNCIKKKHINMKIINDLVKIKFSFANC